MKGVVGVAHIRTDLVRAGPYTRPRGPKSLKPIMKQGDEIRARGAGGPVERGGSQSGTYTEVSVLASEWLILMSG